MITHLGDFVNKMNVGKFTNVGNAVDFQFVPKIQIVVANYKKHVVKCCTKQP